MIILFGTILLLVNSHSSSSMHLNSKIAFAGSHNVGQISDFQDGGLACRSNCRWNLVEKVEKKPRLDWFIKRKYHVSTSWCQKSKWVNWSETIKRQHELTGDFIKFLKTVRDE